MTEGKTSIDLHFEILDSIIGQWRLATVPSALRNDPPHITLLSPWRTPLQETDLDVLKTVLEAEKAFPIRFVKLARFGDNTLYLAPEENKNLSRMMQNLINAFPDTPPYGGVFSELILHVTIAQADDAETLNKLELEISAHLVGVLPISAMVREVFLKQKQENGHWKIHTVIPLE